MRCDQPLYLAVANQLCNAIAFASIRALQHGSIVADHRETAFPATRKCVQNPMCISTPHETANHDRCAFRDHCNRVLHGNDSFHKLSFSIFFSLYVAGQKFAPSRLDFIIASVHVKTQ